MRVALRRLPVTVEPLPDEPLNSWIDAIAIEFHAPARDVLHAVGLIGAAAPSEDRKFSALHRPWLYELRDDQIERLAAATGVGDRQIRGTTRIGFAASVTRRTKRGTVTGLNAAGSIAGRFCPECLNADGRWKLTWSYQFGFACARHRVLLMDACPACGRDQAARRSKGVQVPTPTRCATCSSGLAGIAPRFLATDRIVSAQRSLLRMIASGRARFGVHGDVTVEALEAIEDLRLLQRAIFTRMQRGMAVSFLDLPGQLIDEVRRREWDSLELSSLRHFSAATAAAGFTMAIAAASDRDCALRTIEGVIPADIVYSRFSPMMQGVIAEATGTARRPTSRLQSVRQVSDTALERRRSRLPAVLWEEMSCALVGPDGRYARRRAALSEAVLLVGTRLTHTEARILNGTQHLAEDLSHLLAKNDITEQLIRLAQYLDDDQHPHIDYERRRRVAWKIPLSAKRWVKLANRVGVHPGGVARWADPVL